MPGKLVAGVPDGTMLVVPRSPAANETEPVAVQPVAVSAMVQVKAVSEPFFRNVKT
jgi:hypothetical protein